MGYHEKSRGLSYALTWSDGVGLFERIRGRARRRRRNRQRVHDLQRQVRERRVRVRRYGESRGRVVLRHRLAIELRVRDVRALVLQLIHPRVR